MGDMVMDGFDFSPLFRSTIGFDRMFRMLDAATRVDSASLGYPPFNIEKTGEHAYRLTMAVAGFSPSELDVTVHEDTLLVTGKAQQEEEKKNGNGYLHRGIARRAFERRFSLADHMKVTGANVDNGMLHVDFGARSARGGQAPQNRDRRPTRAAAGNGAEGGSLTANTANRTPPESGGVLVLRRLLPPSGWFVHGTCAAACIDLRMRYFAPHLFRRLVLT